MILLLCSFKIGYFINIFKLSIVSVYISYSFNYLLIKTKMLTFLATATIHDLRQVMLNKLFTRSSITSDRLLWSYSWITYYSTYFQTLRKREEMAKLLIALSSGDYEDFRLRTYDDLHLHWAGERDLYIFNISAAERKRYRIPFFWSAYATKGLIPREFVFVKPGALSHYQYFASVFLLGPLEANWTDIYSQWGDRRVLAFGRFIFWCFGYVYFLWRRFIIPAFKLAWGILDLCIFIVWMLSPFYWIGICFHSIFFRAKTYQLNNVFYTALWSLVWPTIWLVKFLLYLLTGFQPKRARVHTRSQMKGRSSWYAVATVEVALLPLKMNWIKWTTPSRDYFKMFYNSWYLYDKLWADDGKLLKRIVETGYFFFGRYPWDFAKRILGGFCYYVLFEAKKIRLFLASKLAWAYTFSFNLVFVILKATLYVNLSKNSPRTASTILRNYLQVVILKGIISLDRVLFNLFGFPLISKAFITTVINLTVLAALLKAICWLVADLIKWAWRLLVFLLIFLITMPWHGVGTVLASLVCLMLFPFVMLKKSFKLKAFLKDYRLTEFIVAAAYRLVRLQSQAFTILYTKATLRAGLYIRMVRCYMLEQLFRLASSTVLASTHKLIKWWRKACQVLLLKLISALAFGNMFVLRIVPIKTIRSLLYYIFYLIIVFLQILRLVARVVIDFLCFIFRTLTYIINIFRRLRPVNLVRRTNLFFLSVPNLLGKCTFVTWKSFCANTQISVELNLKIVIGSVVKFTLASGRALVFGADICIAYLLRKALAFSKQILTAGRYIYTSVGIFKPLVRFFSPEHSFKLCKNSGRFIYNMLVFIITLPWQLIKQACKLMFHQIPLLSVKLSKWNLTAWVFIVKTLITLPWVVFKALLFKGRYVFLQMFGLALIVYIYVSADITLPFLFQLGLDLKVFSVDFFSWAIYIWWLCLSIWTILLLSSLCILTMSALLHCLVVIIAAILRVTVRLINYFLRCGFTVASNLLCAVLVMPTRSASLGKSLPKFPDIIKRLLATVSSYIIDSSSASKFLVLVVGSATGMAFFTAEGVVLQWTIWTILQIGILIKTSIVVINVLVISFVISLILSKCINLLVILASAVAYSLNNFFIRYIFYAIGAIFKTCSLIFYASRWCWHTIADLWTNNKFLKNQAYKTSLDFMAFVYYRVVTVAQNFKLGISKVFWGTICHRFWQLNSINFPIFIIKYLRYQTIRVFIMLKIRHIKTVTFLFYISKLCTTPEYRQLTYGVAFSAFTKRLDFINAIVAVWQISFSQLQRQICLLQQKFSWAKLEARYRAQKLANNILCIEGLTPITKNLTLMAHKIQTLFGFFKQDPLGPVQVLWFLYYLPSLLYKVTMLPVVQVYSKVCALHIDLIFAGLAFIKSYEPIIYKQVVAFYYVPNDRGVLICRPLFTLIINHFWLILVGFFTACGLLGWYVYFMVKFVVFYIFWIVAAIIQFLLACWVTVLQYVTFFVITVPYERLPAYKSKYYGCRGLLYDYTRMVRERGKAWLSQVYYKPHYNAKRFYLQNGLAYKTRMLGASRLSFIWRKQVLLFRHFVWRHTPTDYVKGFEGFYFLHASDACDFLISKNVDRSFLLNSLPVLSKLDFIFEGIHTALFASVFTLHKGRLCFLNTLKSIIPFYETSRMSVEPNLYKAMRARRISFSSKESNELNTNYDVESRGPNNKVLGYPLLALRINHLLKDIFYVSLILLVGVTTSYSCYYFFDSALQTLKSNLPNLLLMFVELYKFISIFIEGMVVMGLCWIVLWFLWLGACAFVKTTTLKLKNVWYNISNLYFYYGAFTQNLKKFWFKLRKAPNPFQILILVASRSKYGQKLISKSDLIINNQLRLALNQRLSSFVSYLQGLFALNLKTMAKLNDEINTRGLLIWQAIYRSRGTSTRIKVMFGKINKSLKDIDAWLTLKIEQLLPTKLKAKVIPSIDTLWPEATNVPKGIKSKLVFSGFWYKDITKQELPNSLLYGWSRTIYRGSLWLYAMPVHFIVTGAIESLFWVVMIFAYPLYFWLFYIWAWTWFILNCFRRISLKHKPKGKYWVMADLTNTRYNIRWHYFYKKNSLMLNYKPPKTFTSIRHAVLFKRFCSLFPVTVLVKTAEFLTQVLITFVRTPIIDPLLDYIGEIYIKPVFFMVATFAVNIGLAYNNRRYRFYRHVSTYFYELKLKWKVLKLSLLWLFMCIVGRFVFKKLVGFLTTFISLSWRVPLLVALVSARYAIQFLYILVESPTMLLSAGFRRLLLNKKLAKLATLVSTYKPLSWAASGWALILNAVLKAPIILYWFLTICVFKLWYLILLFSGLCVIKHLLYVVRFFKTSTTQVDLLQGLYSYLSKRIPCDFIPTTLDSLTHTFDLLVSGQSISSSTRPIEEYKTWSQLMLETFNPRLTTLTALVTRWKALQRLNSWRLKNKSLHQTSLETITQYVLFIEQRIFQAMSIGADRLHRPLTFVVFHLYSTLLRLSPQPQQWKGVLSPSTFNLLSTTMLVLIEHLTNTMNMFIYFLGQLALRTCASFLRFARTSGTRESRKVTAAFLPHYGFFNPTKQLKGQNRALSNFLSFDILVLGNFFAKLSVITKLVSGRVYKCYRDDVSGYIYKVHKTPTNAHLKYILDSLNTTYHNWVKQPIVAMVRELLKSLIYTPITIFRVVVVTFLDTLRRLCFPSLTLVTVKQQLLETLRQAVLWEENYSTNVDKVQEYFIWSVKALTWYLVRISVITPLQIVWTSLGFTAKFELFVAYNKAVAWAKGKDYIAVKRPPVSLLGHTLLYILRIWMFIPPIIEFYLKLIRRHYYEGYRRYLRRMPASFQEFRRHYSHNRIALSFIQPSEPKELDIIPIGLYKRLETGQSPRRLSINLHNIRHLTISGWHGTRDSFVYLGKAILYMTWKTSIAMWNSGLSWAIWYFLEGVLGFIWWSFIRPHAIVLSIILDYISQTFGQRQKSELYFLMFIPIQAYVKIPLTAFIHTYQARVDKRVWPGVVAVVLGLYFFWKFLLFVHALYVFWPKIALLPASSHVLSLSLVIDVYLFINFWLYVAGMSWIYEVVIRPWKLRYFKVYAPALVAAYLMEVHNYVHQDYDMASFILFMAEHLHYMFQFKLEIRYGFSFLWCTMAVFFWPYFLLQWSLLFPWILSHWEPNIVEYYRKLLIPYAELVRPVYTVGFSLLAAYYNLEFFGTFWFLQLNETDALLNFIAFYGLEDEIWYFDFNTLSLGIEDEWGTHMEYEDYLVDTLPAINYDFNWNFSDMVHDSADIQLPFWTDNVSFSPEGPGEVNIDPDTRTGMRYLRLYKAPTSDNVYVEMYLRWMRRRLRRLHRILQYHYNSTYYTVSDERFAYDTVSKDIVYLFSQNHETKHTIDEHSPLWEHWMASPREESSVTWWDTAHGGWEQATFNGYALAREDCLYIPSSVPWNPLLGLSLQTSHAFGDRIDNYSLIVDRDSYKIHSLPYRQHWYYFWRWGTFEPEVSDLVNLGLKTANYIRSWFLVFDLIHLLIELGPEFVRDSIIELYKLRRQIRIRIMWRILSIYEFRRWYVTGQF